MHFGKANNRKNSLYKHKNNGNFILANRKLDY